MHLTVWSALLKLGEKERKLRQELLQLRSYPFHNVKARAAAGADAARRLAPRRLHLLTSFFRFAFASSSESVFS